MALSYTSVYSLRCFNAFAISTFSMHNSVHIFIAKLYIHTRKHEHTHADRQTFDDRN